MKKYLLALSLILFVAPCFSYTLREGILYADVIVVGRFVYVGADKMEDYVVESEAIAVAEYLKGSEEGLLTVIPRDDMTANPRYGDDESTYLCCLKKFGDGYAVLYQHELIGDEVAYAKKQVAAMLKIGSMPEGKKRFDKTVEWMVDCYCNGFEELDLSHYHRFMEYYEDKGYFNTLGDVLTKEQKERVASYLPKQDKWYYYDTDVAAALVGVASTEELTKHLLNMLSKYTQGDSGDNTWTVGQLMDVIGVLNPTISRSGLWNSVKEDIYSYERQQIGKLIEKVQQEIDSPGTLPEYEGVPPMDVKISN